MKSTRAQAFHSAHACLSMHATVVIVGPISRTWYADRGTLVELFLYLNAYGITPLVIGQGPFLLCAAEAMQTAAIQVGLLEDGDTQADQLFDDADLCIALPARTVKDQIVAGPFAELALQRGVPLLAIWADGNATFTANGAAG